MSEQCFWCKNFVRYYKKGTQNFIITKYGWCCENNENVRATYTCEKHELKAVNKRAEKFTLHSVKELLQTLTQLRQIVDEYNADYQYLLNYINDKEP